MLIAHPHAFPDEEARDRVLALTEYWSTRYAMRGAWRGDAYHIQGKTKGIRFDASFSLRPGKIEVQVKVPIFARKIGRDYVQRKLGMYMDPSRPLESLRGLNRR